MNHAARNTQMSNGGGEEAKQQNCNAFVYPHLLSLESLIKQKYSNNKNAFSGPLHQKNEGGTAGKQSEGSNSKVPGGQGSQTRTGPSIMEVYGTGPNTSMGQGSGANQNQFMQNKYQFATYYGQKNILGVNGMQNQNAPGSQYEYSIDGSHGLGMLAMMNGGSHPGNQA